jgi:hypothetical protein
MKTYPRAGLDDMEKWKFFTLLGLELPQPLVVQPVGRYTDWAIPAPKESIIIIIIIIIIIALFCTLCVFVCFTRAHFVIGPWAVELARK